MYLQEQVLTLWENECLKKAKSFGRKIYTSRCLCTDTRKTGTLGSKGTTTFYFINDGIHSALEKARQSAKGKDIRIQGGANTIQQFLNAGLLTNFSYTLHLFFWAVESDSSTVLTKINMIFKSKK
jgi:hypothetical protein